MEKRRNGVPQKQGQAVKRHDHGEYKPATGRIYVIKEVKNEE